MFGTFLDSDGHCGLVLLGFRVYWATAALVSTEMRSHCF